MKDNLTENEKVTADAAEAENEKNAAAELGKFKDVQTLMKAYSDLEAEFTRRSQRLKELEKGNKADGLPDGAESAPSPTDEEELLKNCYENCLKLAAEHGCRTVAFPSISTGIYRFPLDRASVIAVGAILEFLALHSNMEVQMVCFDKETFQYYQNALKAVCS